MALLVVVFQPSFVLPVFGGQVGSFQATGVPAGNSRTSDQQKNKSVSTRGVARIRDRDFPKRETPTINSVPSQPVSEFNNPVPGSRATINRRQNQHTHSQRVNSSVGSGKASLSDNPRAEPSSQSRASASSEIESTTIQVQQEEVESGSEESLNQQSEASKEEEEEEEEEETETSNSSSWSFGKMTDRKSLPATIQMFVSIAAISLVPAILLMTTCFIRIVVVLGILRQAIGLQQLPPTQVTTGLALMMTLLVMAPTWKEVKEQAIDPYTAEGSTMSWDEAWNSGVTPVKQFMWSQIRRAENENDFWVFYDYLPEEERSKEPSSLEEIPLKALLPAFMISELKVAFLIGLQILLPFLILDIVVASLCNTMGLIMLPPAVVSLPLKLLLFVMVDGWNLVVSMLLNSFALIQV